MRHLLASLALPLLSCCVAAGQVQRKHEDPFARLPANQEVLVRFGERADFSPDNQRIAFMEKSYGDAMVMDLKTRVVTCLTCGIPSTAFLRVMHLANGDYLLIGPEKFTAIKRSRTLDNELWYLSAKPNSKPVKLGVHLHEGAAISKKSLKISYSQSYEELPDLPHGFSQLMTAEVDLSGPTPKVVNEQKVYESHDESCMLEAQDFYDNDRKMTFTCYVHQEGDPNPLAAVMGIDLGTKQVTEMSQSRDTYNECEGIFPDGQHTAVEMDRHVKQLGGANDFRNIDIYKLRLDGSGKDVQRLTFFNDYDGWKSSNPVISTDGKLMAFQVGHSNDVNAGVGYGIVLMHLDGADARKR